MNARFIQFDPKTMAVSVSDAEQPGGVNIPVIGIDLTNDNPFNSRIPLLSVIYTKILYAERGAQDRKAGRRIEHFLVPPDPWLIALGHVMRDGIVQGMTWDGVKLLVKTALAKLREHGVAPPDGPNQLTRKGTIELGFSWTEYSGELKQKEMFVGLRKHYESQSKPSVDAKLRKRTK